MYGHFFCIRVEKFGAAVSLGENIPIAQDEDERGKRKRVPTDIPEAMFEIRRRGRSSRYSLGEHGTSYPSLKLLPSVLPVVVKDIAVVAIVTAVFGSDEVLLE